MQTTVSVDARKLCKYYVVNMGGVGAEENMNACRMNRMQKVHNVAPSTVLNYHKFDRLDSNKYIGECLQFICLNFHLLELIALEIQLSNYSFVIIFMLKC